MKFSLLLPVFALVTSGLQADAPAGTANLPIGSGSAPAKPATDSPPASIKKAAATAPAKTPDDALPTPPPPWRVSAGPQWRQIGSLNFHASTQAALPAAPAKSNPPPVGDPGVVGNRTYSDGYVKTDISGSATTWNWGYNKSGQVNGGATTLTFQASGTVLTQQAFSRSFDTNWHDDPSGAGAFVKFESPDFYRYQNIGFSAEFGYSLTHSASGNAGEAFQGSLQSDLRSVTITDRYDITGIVVPLAPYAGTFNGPGPVISNLPTSRTTATTGDSLIMSNINSMLNSHLTTNLHTFSFGASAHEEIGRFRLGASMGLAMNITSWDAYTHEDIRNGATGAEIQSFDYRHSGNDLHPGFYLEASASVPITERLSFFTSGRYDWSGALHGSAGGSTFNLDLGGWTLAAGLTLKF